MKKIFSILMAWVVVAPVANTEPFQQAEVTRAINSVSLVEKERRVKAAEVGDMVKGETGLKTGVDSRAEIRFPDTTVLRVGANSLFSFQTGGRKMDLESGTMLFSAPRGQGGGEVRAGAVTAAVTGTEFLLARYPNGEVRLVVLEGKVWLYFTANPKVRRAFRAGQAVTVPPNSLQIPAGVTIDLRRLLSTSRLVESGDFAPLPRLALLQRVADSQQGRIRPLPDTLNRDQQTAQTTRRLERNTPSQPQLPRPQVTPPPVYTPPVNPAPTPPPPGPGPTTTPH